MPRKFSELKCPKCNSQDFDEDDATNHDMDGSCDIRYSCNECETIWLVGLFQSYTDDDEIVED
jgi:hypothetical protein